MFDLLTEADESVTFYFDYRDGHQHVTMETHAGHAWEQEGTYSVNITAVTRTSSETKFIEV